MDEASETQNSQDSFVHSALETGQEIFSSYGWLIFFSLVLLYGVWLKFESRWRVWSKKKQDLYEANLIYNDPDFVIQRQESMEIARRRLQEQYEAAAARYAEKLKEKEEEKRQEKIREWEKLQEGKGFHSRYRVAEDEGTSCSRTGNKTGSGASKSKGLSLRPEYNPLMGSGGGTCYRPPRRGLSRGG